MLRIFIERLLARDTWGIVLIVGTLINLYGQILVPMFRGNHAPVETIAHEAESHFIVLIASIVMGYVFPLIVSVLSTTMMLRKSRKPLDHSPHA